MPRFLRQWLMPEPISDNNLAYLQMLIKRIVAMSFVMSTALLIVAFSQRLRFTTPVAGLTVILTGGMLWLTRRGYLTLYRVLLPALAFVLSTFLLVVSNGLHDEGMFSYAFILVLAGLLVGRRGIMVYALLIIGAATAISVAEISGVLVNTFSASTRASHIMMLNLFIGFTAVLLYVTIENLSQSLARSQCLYRKAEQELMQRIQTEQALHLAKADAEFANRAKTNFLCSVSHELRTPLNSILGFGQILEQQMAMGVPNPKHQGFVARILASGHHLLSLVEDILTLSRLDFEEQRLTRQAIPLKPLLEKSLTSLRAKDVKPHLTFAIHLPPELDTADIIADAGAVKQILFQLLSNAVKFTPDGGTIILDAEPRGKHMIIRITDNGIGIAPDQQAHIFDNFYQVQGGLVGKTPGTGLGLPIARRLVELHGGTLWVESAGEGQGCRFSFSLTDSAYVPYV